MSTDAELQAAGIAVPKRTDLPWSVEVDEYETGGGQIAIPEINRILHDPEWADPEDWDRDLANAQLIVTAVNAHDDLVAALKQLLPVAYACKHEDFGNVDGAEWTRTEAIERSVAALRKAGAL